MSERSFQKLLRKTASILAEKSVETQRLYLRQFCAEDFEDFYEFTSQKEVQRLSGIPERKSTEEARAAFAKILPKRNRACEKFAVVFRETGKVIGHFSLAVYPFLLTDPVLSQLQGLCAAFALNEAYQRRGLMTELLREAIRRLFEDCGLDYLSCGYFSFNEGSRRLQEKVGMHRYLTHPYRRGDEMLEVVETVLFRSEYSAAKDRALPVADFQ